MARPQKTGLDYFPLDVGFYRDIKVRKLMRSNGGGKALAVYTVLLCNIYENGYYMVWDDDVPFMLSEILGFEEGTVHEAIKFCLSVGLLDKELFASHHILTSRSIQSRYLAAVKRRVKDVSTLPYLYPELLSETQDVSTETEFLHTETPLMSAGSTVNKKKVNDKSSLRSDLLSPSSSPLTTRVNENEEKGILLSGTEFLHTETPKMPTGNVDVADAAGHLKRQRDWLLQMQQLHGIHASVLVNWLDVFVNECACRGKTEHESMSDVMQHFNDWLKIKVSQRKKASKKGAGEVSPPDYQKRWTMCLAELCQSVSAEEASKTYSLMRYETYSPKERYLLVQVPSSEVYERLEKDCIKTLTKFVHKYFGSCQLKYRITGSPNGQ